MPAYRHRQMGVVAGVCLLIGLAVTGTAALLVGEVPTPVRIAVGTVALILLACLVIFTSLVVEVNDERVWLGFGPGLVQRTFPLDTIRHAQAVRNPWYYGWGIRIIPGGWMWNVSGLDAVELELRNGRRFRIGTDEPEELADTIRRVLPHNR